MRTPDDDFDPEDDDFLDPEERAAFDAIDSGSCGPPPDPAPNEEPPPGANRDGGNTQGAGTRGKTTPPPPQTQAGSGWREPPDSSAHDATAMPHAVMAEKSVVSVILQYPERLPEVADLTPEHFYTIGPRLVLTTVREMADAGGEPELVGLIERLRATGRLDLAGGPSAVSDIYSHDMTGGLHLAAHAAILRENFARRRAIELSASIRAAAYERTEDSAPLVEALAAAAALVESAKGATGHGRPLPTIHHAEVSAVAESADFVEGLLTSGGSSIIFGPSNTGKSFWVLDLAASNATGRQFRDELAVEQGAVIYVALEGNQGIRNRVLAMRRAGRLPDSAPFYLVTVPVNLLHPDCADQLAATVRVVADRAGMPVTLVVIDTWARAMAGGDENGITDTGLAVATVDAVRAATGAHVACVHHAGKDASKGARGHSALRAAVDTEIEITRPEGESVSTARVTKQRDLPMGPPMPFSLEVVELGTDSRGRAITSCTVRHEDEFMASNRKPGRKHEVAPVRLLNLLPQPSTAGWAKAARDEFGVSASAFYRAKDELHSAGKATRDGKGWKVA